MKLAKTSTRKSCGSQLQGLVVVPMRQIETLRQTNNNTKRRAPTEILSVS